LIFISGSRLTWTVAPSVSFSCVCGSVISSSIPFTVAELFSNENSCGSVPDKKASRYVSLGLPKASSPVLGLFLQIYIRRYGKINIRLFSQCLSHKISP